ncbi:unnamed protein product, partial [Nesidiocoris tenuis]
MNEHAHSCTAAARSRFCGGCPTRPDKAAFGKLGPIWYERDAVCCPDSVFSDVIGHFVQKQRKVSLCCGKILPLEKCNTYCMQPEDIDQRGATWLN